MPGGGVELVLLVVEAGSGEEVDLERDLGRPEVLRGTVGPLRSVPSSSPSSVVLVRGLRWSGRHEAEERVQFYNVGPKYVYFK